MSGSLARAEVDAGLARLKAAPFMARNVSRSDESGTFFIGDQALQFMVDQAPVISKEFASENGIPTEAGVPQIIAALAAALVLSRLGPAEAFRLGTSPESLLLFTGEGDWGPTARLAS